MADGGIPLSVRINVTRELIRHHQERNRLAARDLELGRWVVKRLGRKLRELMEEKHARRRKS